MLPTPARKLISPIALYKSPLSSRSLSPSSSGNGCALCVVESGAMAASSSPVFKQPQRVNPNSLPFFNRVAEDILNNVFARLEQDPRNLARLACVCRRFKNAIRTTCWRHQCIRVVPTVVCELMSQQSIHSDLIGEPPGGWGSLQKLLVCCPGPRHAGVLLESWDFGLERELGSSEDYCNNVVKHVVSSEPERMKMKESEGEETLVSSRKSEGPIRYMKKGGLHYHNKVMQDQRIVSSYRRSSDEPTAGHVTSDPRVAEEKSLENDKGVVCNDSRAHLAKGSWSLTREQGNKLLASRFRDDSLFISDWPGCCHQGEKRVYKLFRGVFKNFKQSHVWRNLRDQGCKHTDLSCAYCPSRKTYDLVTSFCLRRSLEYHEDGEPVVRAYVCETNGHVAGAWTDRPLFHM